MDTQSVVQLINQTGFPIVACCALFYLCNTTIKQNTDVLKEVSNTLSLLIVHLEKGKEG